LGVFAGLEVNVKVVAVQFGAEVLVYVDQQFERVLRQTEQLHVHHQRQHVLLNGHLLRHQGLLAGLRLEVYQAHVLEFLLIHSGVEHAFVLTQLPIFGDFVHYRHLVVEADGDVYGLALNGFLVEIVFVDHARSNLSHFKHPIAHHGSDSLDDVDLKLEFALEYGSLARVCIGFVCVSDLDIENGLVFIGGGQNNVV